MPVSKDGKLLPAVGEILKVVAKYDMAIHVASCVLTSVKFGVTWRGGMLRVA